MAPEQFLPDGTVAPATDIFALGMIAYSLLVGKPYWLRESKAPAGALALAVQVARGPTESPVKRAFEMHGVSLPDEFDAWFFRATHIDPAKRFDYASDAVRELSTVLGVRQPDNTVAGMIPPNPVGIGGERAAISDLNLNLRGQTVSRVNTSPTESGLSSTRRNPSGRFPAWAVGGILIVAVGCWIVYHRFVGGNSPTAATPQTEHAQAAPPSMALSGQRDATPAQLVATQLPPTSLEQGIANTQPSVTALPSAHAPAPQSSASSRRKEAPKAAFTGVPWSR